MKYHLQTIHHNPEDDEYGDCFRTVIACLLDRDPVEVPHVFADPEDNGVALMNKWLAQYGFYFGEAPYSGDLPLSEILSTGNYIHQGNRYTLLGRTANGTNHIVICKGDRIEHNTCDEDIVAPAISTPDTPKWWIGFIGRVS